jgi:hypothetical protein
MVVEDNPMANTDDDEINHVMQQLTSKPGYAPWARVCMSLLALTEGLDRYTEVEEDNPHSDLAARVNKALSTNEETKLLDIAGLSAFDYRVMCKKSTEVWNPLKESLQHFLDRHDGEVMVWKEFSPHPTREEIEAWLKQRVYS